MKSALQEKNPAAVANLFKALADETRMKIAYALLIEGELCVCDAAEITGSSNATASHHLRLLKSLGLARFRKEGKQVYYALDDDHVRQLIEVAFAHQEEVAARG
ncbi:metalloregulator ArsR/SmtB family transcription factor [Bacillus sp. FJAT-42376]|uniref:ArsR/SmtB family transcription factor n=1 Tax=Bacillus sp. FJAT-42376 TaxID=2014076 RepID=UPI001F15143F|nr:metalloregulator ArsR/SmtB family transcription factor [Bacillus sp. FJAT-42376]